MRGVSSHAMLTSTPTPSPSTGPIIEVPSTPKSADFSTNEELEEKKANLKAAQVNLTIKFKDKLRDNILYLIDRIEWPMFYEELSKVVNILSELRSNQTTLR